MATELTWLGHGSWSIASGDTKILLDPFLDDTGFSELVKLPVHRRRERTVLFQQEAYPELAPTLGHYVHAGFSHAVYI